MLNEVASPVRRIREQYNPLFDSIARMESMLKPFMEQSERLTVFTTKFQSLDLLKPRSSCQSSISYADGKPLKSAELTPQLNNPLPRPTTLDKRSEIREAYAKARHDLGKFAPVGKIIDAVKKETGVSRANIYRALEDKK
ncbi:hypothetical protein [Thiothrix sp.]|jgi:hypothetical protein|uniref:hypothetical protein n=1 Tax=Thiothrix sp. TaxID=1032 RepID=UPI00257E77C8|nr:hypothetical protein [Thiothrix sp.]